MARLLCILVLAAVLPACTCETGWQVSVSRKPGEKSTEIVFRKREKKSKPPPAPEKAAETEKSKSFCGSEMSVEKAMKKSDLVVLAKAMSQPAMELEHKSGAVYCTREEFGIIRVLNGSPVAGPMDVNYRYDHLASERRVEEGEKVILYLSEEIQMMYGEYITRVRNMNGEDRARIMAKEYAFRINEAVKILPALK